MGPRKPRPRRALPAAAAAARLTRAPLCFCAAEDAGGLERALSELTSETDVPVVFVKRREIGGLGPTLKVGGAGEGGDIDVLYPPAPGGGPRSPPSPCLRPAFQAGGGCERSSQRSASLKATKQHRGPAHVLLQVAETAGKFGAGRLAREYVTSHPQKYAFRTSFPSRPSLPSRLRISLSNFKGF